MFIQARRRRRQIVLLEPHVAVLQAKVKAPWEECSGESGESLVGNFHPGKAVWGRGDRSQKTLAPAIPRGRVWASGADPGTFRCNKKNALRQAFVQWVGFLLLPFSCFRTVLGCQTQGHVLARSEFYHWAVVLAVTCFKGAMLCQFFFLYEVKHHLMMRSWDFRANYPGLYCSLSTLSPLDQWSSLVKCVWLYMKATFLSWEDEE